MSFDNNGRIQKPIGLPDICTAVKWSTTDLGTAISRGRINKWSKFKPMKNPNKDINPEDNPELYKGTETEQSNGVLYGMKVGTKDLSDIHTSTWEYVGRPNGGTSEWYRYLDFLYYDKNAKPTILGNAAIYTKGEVDYSLNKPLAVTVEWYESTGYNVDIEEMTATSGDIGGYYVVAVIGEWARVMKNSHQSDAITPIVYNGVRQEAFNLELPDGTPIYSITGGDIVQPNFQQYNAGLNVSFALCAVDDMADTSLKSRWVHMRNVVLSSPAISLPNVVGAVLPFIDGMNYHGEWDIVGCIFDRYGDATINLECIAPVQRYAGFEVQMDFWYNGGIEAQGRSSKFYLNEGFEGEYNVDVNNPLGITTTTKTYTVYVYLNKDIGGELARYITTYTHSPS